MASSESPQCVRNDVERNGEITNLEIELQELQQPLLCQDERDSWVDHKEESYDVENPCTQLASSIKGNLDKLPTNWHHPSSECIYRVPKIIRTQKAAVYTPQVVSIGPLHHGQENLKVMEEHKRRYLKNFLDRSNVSLEDYIAIVKDNEVKLRDCYAETIQIDSDKFVEMILVDVTFIIELLLLIKKGEPERNVKENRFINVKGSLMKREVLVDMLLLENQIPYFIFEKIHDAAAKIKSSPSKEEEEEEGRLSIADLFYHSFKHFFPAFLPSSYFFDILLHSSSFLHFLDFLRIAYQPTYPSDEQKYKSSKKWTLTALQQAGVKFQMLDPSNYNMFDIQFTDGILQIPKIEVIWGTEILLRNLVAFEQCNCETNFLADYAIFLDSLIDAEKDIEILVHNGVLESWSSDNKTPLHLFNGLATSCSLNPENFFFAGLWQELDDYYEAPWHKWKAILQQDYFNTPWATISVMAAVVLLILTVLQTVWSITHP